MTHHPLFDLTGKAVLLTGSSSGMGLATARAMGLAGARLFICGLDASETETAVADLREQGLQADGFSGDLGTRDVVSTLFQAAIEAMERVDILVCNAGVVPPMGSQLEMSDECWERILRVNLQSVHWLTQLAIPPMAARRDGSVIITASLASVRGNKALGLYGISKAAVAQLVRNLAVEFGPANVRVNAISPGVIRTPFAGPMLREPAVMAKRVAATPLRRIGEPEEVAGVALMLASPAGAFITGQNLIVDGGTTIGDGN